MSCSPHPWGCSQRGRADHRRPRAAPRTRGDAPCSRFRPQNRCACSPHRWGCSSLRHRQERGPRGCSHCGCDDARRQHLLFAFTGMFPSSPASSPSTASAPRILGDVPAIKATATSGIGCSSHARGWSRSRGEDRRGDRLFPAPTGTFPAPTPSSPEPAPAPRTRVIRYCSPHRRGRSQQVLVTYGEQVLLPHPRGGSDADNVRIGLNSCFPRPRGMFPGCTSATTLWPTASRLPGDVLPITILCVVAVLCSLHR